MEEQAAPGVHLPTRTTPALALSVLCNYFGTLGTSDSLKLPERDVAGELWLIWVDFSSAWLQLPVPRPPSPVAGKAATRVLGAGCTQLAGSRAGSEDPTPGCQGSGF